MENRSHALIAGLFTLLVGLAALAALWWFGGQREETNRYVVTTLRNVTGLSQQAQVRYRGISVGRVERIALDPKNPRLTLIDVTVDKDVPVTRGTTAKLGYQGLTGIAHILLEDDGRDPAPLPPGNGQSSRIPMADSLIQELTDVGGDTLRNARELLANLNDILSPENRRAITRSLGHLEATAENVQATSAQLRTLLSAENLARFEATLARAERTAGEASAFFSEARGLVSRLDSTRDRMEAAVIDSAAGFGGLAPRLNVLAGELADTTRQLNRVLQMLEDSPQSLVFGRQRGMPGPGENGFVAPPGAGDER